MRRILCGIFFVSCVSLVCAADSKVSSCEVPYKVLFNNDSTNVQTCISPYHPENKQIDVNMFVASVHELDGHGVDAYMIQPGTGWVAWWKSKLYPIEEQHKWFKEHYGIEGDNQFDSILLSGKDFLGAMIEQCHKDKMAAFISLRMNDAHHLEHTLDPQPWLVGVISRFYAEHYHMRLGESKKWCDNILDWGYPEVREHKLKLIKELCETYDIEGFELDFMRAASSYFNLDKTTSSERIAIINDFIHKVRQILDETTKDKKHRFLCVRIPAYTACYDSFGIDLPSMVENGVEMVNASAHYFTDQGTDFQQIVRSVPKTAVYLEMCHATCMGQAAKNSKYRYDNWTFRRTTPEQYYTTAHLAYTHGAKGVSLFNFVYYRQHGTGDGRGPFNEPPFEAIDRLADKEWLKSQPQHYFLGWQQPEIAPIEARDFIQLPKIINRKYPVRLVFNMAPPAKGWNGIGKLKIQTEEALKDKSKYKASLNGTPLKPCEDVSEPYPNPYSPLLGTNETLCAWYVPADVMRKGENTLSLRSEIDESAKILFVDIAVK